MIIKYIALEIEVEQLGRSFKRYSNISKYEMSDALDS